MYGDHNRYYKEEIRMTTLRIASINGEWMNNWFTSDGTPAAFVPSFKLPGENISNSTDKTASKLAAEITAIDPDVLAIEEVRVARRSSICSSANTCPGLLDQRITLFSATLAAPRNLAFCTNPPR